MPKSTTSPVTRKPATPRKPSPDFPLFRHASGRWARKIGGRFHCFGKVSADPQGTAALAKWNQNREALLSGRVPHAEQNGVPDVHGVCNAFMLHKKALLDAGELTERSYGEYHATGKRLASARHSRRRGRSSDAIYR